MSLLPLRSADELAARNDALPSEALRTAAELIERVRDGGESALRDLTERFGERVPADPLVLEPRVLRKALDALGRADRDARRKEAESLHGRNIRRQNTENLKAARERLDCDHAHHVSHKKLTEREVNEHSNMR